MAWGRGSKDIVASAADGLTATRARVVASLPASAFSSPAVKLALLGLVGRPLHDQGRNLRQRALFPASLSAGLSRFEIPCVPCRVLRLRERSAQAAGFATGHAAARWSRRALRGRFDARGGRSEVCGDAIVQWWGLKDERSDVAGRAIGSLHRPLARKADVRRTHGQPLHKSTQPAADWPTKQ